ncbi:MAG: hypothetical protein JOY69_01080 [Candidatus Eremiobacteraeota bacterium]|nr:hypothetical protein [Candidatus Eremiobacteraeota bacterium]
MKSLARERERIEACEHGAVAAIILIAAPFIGQGGWPSEEITPQPDLEGRLSPDVPVFLYQGGEDETVPTAHVALYAKAIPRAQVRLLNDRDHQLNNDLSEVAADIRVITDSRKQ